MATELNHSPARDDIHAQLEKAGAPAARKRKRRYMLLVILLVLFAVIIFLWRTQDQTGTIRYATSPVRKGDITVTVSATGNLQPTNQVEVGSELSGIVKAVNVDYNDQVRVGEVLAELDTSKLAAQILQSEASLDSARAKVQQTQATIRENRAALERLIEVGKLSNNKAVSKSDLESAQAALDRSRADNMGAKAEVLQAEATLKLNRTELAKTSIHSPINGTVLTRSVETGQTVAASFQAPVLFTLAEDLTKMELHVDVDEADVGQVQAGQQAIFTVDAYPDRVYAAEITQIRYGATTTNGVVTYQTVLKVDNSDLSLRPGMTATAKITVAKANDVLLVSNAAFRYEPSTPSKPDQNESLLSKIFPRPQRRPGKQRERIIKFGKNQHVWLLENNQPVAVSVTTGLTDGTLTQLVGDKIALGTELIVDTETIRK